MILHLVEILKKIRKPLFGIGNFLSVLGIIGMILIKNPYAFIIAGIGSVLWAPDFFFLASEHKTKFGRYDVQYVYYCITSLGLGLFFIILPFIL